MLYAFNVLISVGVNALKYCMMFSSCQIEWTGEELLVEQWFPTNWLQSFLINKRISFFLPTTPSPPLDNIRVMVIVWRLRGNIIRTAPCWVVWHNVHSQQHTHVSSSYRFSRLGLSYWDPYAMHRGSCLELYYCNLVEWCWWNSSLIWKTNWLPSVLWHCWFGHMTCKNRPRYDL